MHCSQHVGYINEKKKLKSWAARSLCSSGFSLENISKKETAGFYGIYILNFTN